MNSRGHDGGLLLLGCPLGPSPFLRRLGYSLNSDLPLLDWGVGVGVGSGVAEVEGLLGAADLH